MSKIQVIKLVEQFYLKKKLKRLIYFLKYYSTLHVLIINQI